MIKSVFEDQDELLRAILQLTGEERFELDPCFSKGMFYKNVPLPRFCFDAAPQDARSQKVDCRALPFPPDTIRSIIFDPPFLATTGPSLGKGDGNKIANRFSVYPNEPELHQFYYDSLREFERVLVHGGWLVVKCQDKVSSGKQYFSHVYLHNMAVSLGLYPKDLLVYVKKNRISAAWQTANQQHARKFHSYFWIFEKRPLRVVESKLWEVKP
jgi:hypothetical protein